MIKSLVNQWGRLLGEKLRFVPLTSYGNFRATGRHDKSDAEDDHDQDGDDAYWEEEAPAFLVCQISSFTVHAADADVLGRRKCVLRAVKLIAATLPQAGCLPTASVRRDSKAAVEGTSTDHTILLKLIYSLELLDHALSLSNDTLAHSLNEIKWI